MLRPDKMYQGKTSLYYRHAEKVVQKVRSRRLNTTILQKFKAMLRGTIV